MVSNQLAPKELPCFGQSPHVSIIESKMVLTSVQAVLTLILSVFPAKAERGSVVYRSPESINYFSIKSERPLEG